MAECIIFDVTKRRIGVTPLCFAAVTGTEGRCSASIAGAMIYFLTLSVLGLCLTTTKASAQFPGCPSLSPQIAIVIKSLKQKNYRVQCGSIVFPINSQGQCTDPQNDVNPATCYGEVSVPRRDGGFSFPVFQLDDDEAILTLGILPPPAAYYGYYTYINARLNPTVSPPAYFTIRAPVGPTMNPRNADPGLHAELGGNAYQMFGQGTAIVSTANKVTQSDIVSALGYVYGAGYAQHMTYVEELPVDLIKMGSAYPADELRTAMRLTPFTAAPGQFDQASLQYMRQPRLFVFRISPAVPRTGISADTYTMADDPLPNPQVGHGQAWEHTLLGQAGVADADEALSSIVANVVQDRAAEGRALLATLAPPSGWYLVGRWCVAAYAQGLQQAMQSHTELVVTREMRCVDASPDAAYYGTDYNTVLSFPPGGEIVTVGVNHAALGSATFSNVAIQNPVQYAFGLSSQYLSGTAAPYLGSVPASAAGDFYVVSLNEHCPPGSFTCMQAPSETPITLDERAYLAPPTATHPAYEDVIPSVWMIFGPRLTEGAARAG